MDEQMVRAHLARIVESDGFARAPRLCRFLEFTVEATLRGEAAGGLKEYVLGREVFDRDERYDPRLDPIVRVEARRLRARLDAYYDGPGRAEPLRIEFPKGGYAPVISAPAAVSAPVPRRSRRGLLVAGGVLVPALAGVALWTTRRPLAVAVIPARWLRPGAAPDPAEDALAEAVSVELTRRGAVAVAGWPPLLRWRGQGAELAAIAAAARVPAVAVVSLRETEAVVHLVDAASGRKRWAEFYGPGDGLAARVAGGLEGAVLRPRH